MRQGETGNFSWAWLWVEFAIPRQVPERSVHFCQHVGCRRFRFPLIRLQFLIPHVSFLERFEVNLFPPADACPKSIPWALGKGEGGRGPGFPQKETAEVTPCFGTVPLCRVFLSTGW